MLKEILSISGKPGLFKILAHKGRNLIVEELTTGRKFPVSARDRIMSLGDIAMYTEGDDKPLGEILDEIYTKENGKELDVKEIMSGEGLKSRFEIYVPDFDKERVHDNDIKKLFNWYNLLVSKGFSKFKEEEPKEEVSESAEEKKSDKE